MLTKMKMFVVAGAVAMAGPMAAQAATAPGIQVMFTNGNYAIPSYTTATVFQSFQGLGNNQTYVPRVGESTTGDVRTFQGTIPGTAVQPTTSADNTYLSIITGSYGVTFTTPVQFFSFILGSLDNYNTVTLGFANGSSETLTGRQIIGDTVTGPFNSSVSGRVSYDVGGQSGITSALFTSRQAAFEIDSLASAVPEAATWAMMMVGLGMVGGSLRRRRSITTRVTFA